MRIFGALGAALAVGAMLAACTKQGGDPGEAAGRIARASTQATAANAFAGSTPSSAKPTRFAALPDHGELLRYDAQAPIRDGAYTWHRTELSEQHALDAIATGMLRVATPDGRILGFRYDHSIRHQESGDWTWVGHLAGQKGVQAILTFGEKAVFGSIGQPDARPLRLTMQGGASWLVETDPTQLAGLASHAANPIAPDYHIIPPAALERLRQLRRTPAGVQAGALSPSAASATAAATPTVDLLIGYTQGFVTAKGSTSAVVTRLNSMVDTANEGLNNSQVNGQIRLVHTMQVNYTDTNTNDAALGQLTGYDVDNQSQTTPNAAFNALRQAREQYGADLVSLVRPFRTPEQDSCGIAWLVGGGKQGSEVEPSNGWDFFGYSVVSDGTDKDEGDNKTYYCEEHTLAHELGHNMGSNHDRETSKGSDGVLDDPDDFGAFDYSFGYKPTAFYTIMAYGDSGQTSYLVFSNPRVTFCGGIVCGLNNSADNSRSLGTMLPIVAQFRSAGVPATSGIVASDFDGDGVSDILWRHGTAGSNAIWKSGNINTQQQINGLRDLAWKAVGTGDFDGDGKSDILWRHSGAGSNVIWKSGNINTQQTIGGIANLAWKVVGIGDFDGDNQSDILWRNSSTGSNAIWKSGNINTQQPISGVGNLAWKVVGIGDFDGDGKSDILWRNSSTGGNAIWRSGNINTQQPITGITDLSWKIVGVGDFDGDGKSDVLWRHSGTGNNAIWKSGGINTQQPITRVTDLSWKVEGVGDYDGDGKADILWRNASTGNDTIWKSADISTQQVTANILDLAWAIVGKPESY